MPDSILTQIERRLIASRLPLSRRQRALQELSEHREDLVRAAIEDGLSEIEAGIRADQSLGDPYEVAEEIVLAARRSSWWGRHPVVGFCVVPFFGVASAIILAVYATNGLFKAFDPGFCLPGRLGLNEMYYAFHVWGERQNYLPAYIHLAQLLAVGLVALIFCTLAVRSASKRLWMWVACVICSVQSSVWAILLLARGFAYGHLWWPKELVPVETALIPLAIALLFDVRQRRILRGGQYA